MNNQIKNEKVEVPTGMGLNDKDYLTCLNTTLKTLSKGYVVAMTEASNKSLYEVYKNIFLEISQLQRNVFEVMFRKGWYVLEAVDSNKINSKYNTLSTEYSELGE